MRQAHALEVEVEDAQQLPPPDAIGDDGDEDLNDSDDEGDLRDLPEVESPVLLGEQDFQEARFPFGFRDQSQLVSWARGAFDHSSSHRAVADAAAGAVARPGGSAALR